MKEKNQNRQLLTNIYKLTKIQTIKNKIENLTFVRYKESKIKKWK